MAELNRDTGSRIRGYSVRLFVAGNALNSRIARENLGRLRNSDPEAFFEVEIVDVLEDSRKALDAGIYVTPALQVLKPEPGGIVYGNLSDLEALKGLLT